MSVENTSGTSAVFTAPLPRSKTAGSGPIRYRSDRLIEGVRYRLISQSSRDIDAIWDSIDEDLDPALVSTPMMREAGEPELSRLEFRRCRPLGEAYTYFARGKWTGRIKIGRSNDPHRRVGELINARNGEESTLEVTLRGFHFEPFYHEAFAAHAHGNEWFRPHADILDEIERLQSLAVPDYVIERLEVDA